MGAISKRERDHFTPGVIAQLADLEQEMGGRNALVGMLVLAPLTPDLKYVLGMLGDPEHQGLSLAAICAKGGILPGDLLKHLASAALLRGKVRASQAIAKGIGAVAEDVMRRAAPYEDACHGCRGVGTITPEPGPAVPNPSPEMCETCLGTGRLMYQPDLERQKIAIEMAQLLPKGGGLNIAMQQNVASGGMGGNQQGLTERLQAMTDKFLYGTPGGPVDGEEVPDAPDVGSEPDV